MICKRCGSQIFNNATSCPFCGAVTGAENETDTSRNLIPDLESLSAPAAPPEQFAAPEVPPQPDSGAPVQNPFADDPIPKNPFADDPIPKNPFADDPIPKNPFADDPIPKNPFADDPIPKNPFAQNPSPQNPLPPLGGAGGPSASSFSPLPPISSVQGSGAGVSGKFPMRLTAKIMICIALLCFFMPFVTVSCSMGDLGSDKVIATYNGFELMSGNLDYEDPAAKMNESLNGMFGEGFFNDYADASADDDDDDSGFGFEDVGADDDMLSLFGNVQQEQNAAAEAAEEAEAGADQQKKNYYLIGAFICGIVAFGLLFIKDKKLEIVSMLFSVIAAMLTLISSLTFTSFYHVTASEEMAQLIKVKTRYGVYTVAVFFILAAAAALMEQINVNSSTGDY
ncbi:MAG: hypothetical protein IKX57_01870 [Oscillospiraceae bacterium]|nr:hypothetical protein [Oscillospiraceae bacterium]